MENFDLMAASFDTEMRVRRAKVISDKMSTYISVTGEQSAIEFGCGTGLIGLQLAKHFQTLRLVDSSPEMIKQVERKLEKLNNPAISALCGDLLSHVPQDLNVDCIFSSLVLHHIIDTSDILHRFHSILNDGGRLLIVDLDQDDGSFHAKYPDFSGHNGFEHSALTKIARSVGFRHITIETFYRSSKIHNGKENSYSFFILCATKENT